MSSFTVQSALDRRDWLLDIGAQAVRCECGITQRTMASALGVSTAAVSLWENGLRVPFGPKAIAYCRVIAGLARHLEAGDDAADFPHPGTTDILRRFA